MSDGGIAVRGVGDAYPRKITNGLEDIARLREQWISLDEHR